MPAAPSLPLRDIHLPDAVAWWPPAPGWWIIAGLLVLLAVLLSWSYRRYQGRRLQREAARALDEIHALYDSNHDDQVLIQSLSIWLRRVCISYFPAAEVAGLTGAEWLRLLDKNMAGTSAPQAFSQGPGKMILSAPYQAFTADNGAELLSLCRTWINRLPRRHRRPS